MDLKSTEAEPHPELVGFDSKECEPQLAIIFLLAYALRAIRDHLYFSNWRGKDLGAYIDELEWQFLDAISEQDEDTHALLSWDSFAARMKARRAPSKIQALLEEGRAAIASAVQAGFDPSRFMARVDERARMAVDALASRIGLPRAMPTQPARIRIVWNKGDFTRPSTAVEPRQISWHFQLRAGMLWATVAAEAILRHEYISHLLPESKSLPDTVREGWLMEALGVDIRDHGGTPAENAIFVEARRKLGRPGQVVIEGVAALISRRRPTLFWDLTRDLLALPPGNAIAQKVDAALGALIGIGIPALTALIDDGGSTGLDWLYAATRSQR